MVQFRKYSSTLMLYCRQRLCQVKLPALALLLMLPGHGSFGAYNILICKYIFLLSSLLVFRMLDDLWSFHLDRKTHPDRVYLAKENIGGMIAGFAVTYVIYQLILFAFLINEATAVFGLFLVSTVLYLLFYKNRVIMMIIPLLKYPALIYIISGFRNDILTLNAAAGMFILMLSYDIFERVKMQSRRVLIYYLMLVICGGFLFHIEVMNMTVYMLILLLPAMCIYLRKYKGMAVLPVVIYPIIHLLLRLLSDGK